MYDWGKIFQEIKKYKRELFLGHLFAILATAVSIPTPLFLPLLVDEVLLNKPGIFVHTYQRIFGEGNPVTYTLAALIIVLVMRFLFFVLNALQSKIFTKISKNVTYKIREDLLNHIKDLSMSEFETVGSGGIASKLITDVNTIDDFIGKTVSRFIISVLTIIGVALVLIMINWKLGLLIVLLNPVVIYFTTVVGRKIGKLKAIENKAVEKFQEKLVETLDLFWQIRASNREKSFIKSVLETAKEVKETSIEFGWKSDAAARLSMLVFLSGYEIFRAVSILFVAYSDLTIGLMLAIFGYLWVMMTPVQELLGIQYAFHSGDAALKRINKIFEMKKEPKYPHILNSFKNKKTCSVKLKDVYFSYDGKNYVIKGVNLIAETGKKVAIVGASGSGKTTLAHIMVGFYPVDKGDVLYDDISVKEIGLDVVRENVSLVLQNPMMFNDTVRFNLTLGKDIPESKIWEALEIAQMKDVVENLPDKLDTLIGKNGIKLSGGQRQRLAIARMILQNPKIVILDESTSALDTHTEYRLFNALQEYLKEKTTIIIAHRLSTVQQADYIYVIDRGEIVEEGTHQELMEKEGLYNQFMRKHFML
ncbi:ATP-binding cassette, subfamily C [Persephonella hydrogeniphila]|uniref:ATP-binding cassette, subfamily C n=1 Tax=Persephonella hydrogeniphila TaxID=198703 RepID=A0A285MZR5_9AQUI|nr:ABC transporter ATP-binding protein [Persephonella hydrogeniphila]SNZ02682.1 ATP-binding cassette, subfamily C [Persephonella hydrogeniphila]